MSAKIAAAVAAAAIALAVTARPAPAANTNTWPAAGNWQVISGTLADGQHICTAQHKAVQMNGFGYTLGFSFSEGQSRLSIIHVGPGAPLTASVSINADGRPVASFAAISGGPGFGPGNALHPIISIMPGDSFSRVLIPALSAAHNMTITAGNRSYNFALADFSGMVNELSDCARLMIKQSAHP
jgi:hypothetical protein